MINLHPVITFAYQNLKKSKTITGLAILAVVLGVLLITSLLVLTDSLVNSVDDSLDLVSDVIVIKEKNTLDPTFSSINTSVIDILLEENSTGSLQGLISSYSDQIWYLEKSETGIYGFTQVLGVQPSKEIETVGILNADNFIEGRTLNDGDFNASVVGTTFAYSKGVEIGDYLEVAGKNILVVGIFNTGSFIDASIFMPIDMVRTFRLTYTTETISTILIKPIDRVGGGQIIEYINENLRDELNIEASDFEEMAEQGRKFIEITADFALNIGIISIIIGSLSVFNAILMSVMERKREIAVLKALGWTDNEVGIEVLMESLIISFVGGIIWLLSGIGVAIYVTATSNFLDLDIVPLTLIKSYGFAVVLGIFGGLYPAIRAIQIDPIVDISG